MKSADGATACDGIASSSWGISCFIVFSSARTSHFERRIIRRGRPCPSAAHWSKRILYTIYSHETNHCKLFPKEKTFVYDGQGPFPGGEARRGFVGLHITQS